MKAFRFLFLVIVLAVSVSGRESMDQVTILFTSDVKGRIRPAG